MIETDGSVRRVSTIVVGVDFSFLGEVAFDWAMAMAARDGAVLHAVHVMSPEPLWSAHAGRASDGANRAEIERRLLGHLQERLDGAELAPKSAIVHVMTGKPAEQISRVAEAIDADLIVVATPGWRGLRELLFGSVAERIVRHAGCPVMVVRPRVFDAATAHGTTKTSFDGAGMSAGDQLLLAMGASRRGRSLLH